MAIGLPIERADNRRRGILFMLAGSLMTALMSVIIKWQSERYPFGELIFIRSLIAMIPIMAVVWSRGGIGVVRTRRYGALLWRGTTWLVSVATLFIALSLLPLGDAAALSYAAPLFATALAIPLLGDRIGVRQWLAVIFGFAGVLIVVRPGNGLLNVGAVFAVVSAAAGGLALIGVRELGKTERGITITFWTMGFGVLLSTLLGPWTWILPYRADLLALAGLGLTGGLSQMLTTEAMRAAPPATVTPFIYLQLVWAFLFQYLFWGEPPDLPAILGSAIIVASGFYVATARR